MGAIHPGYDIGSLFNTSWQTDDLVRERVNHELAIDLLTAFLMLLTLGLSLGLLQNFLENTSADPLIVEPYVKVAEPANSQSNQAVSEHIAPGPGYLGR